MLSKVLVVLGNVAQCAGQFILIPHCATFGLISSLLVSCEKSFNDTSMWASGEALKNLFSRTLTQTDGG